MRRLLSISVLFLFSVLTVNAGQGKYETYKSKPITHERYPEAGPAVIPFDGAPVQYIPYYSDDPIGELTTCGTTWYDIQHNGSCGRQIQMDSGSMAHISWMNGMDYGASQRHIYYQIVDEVGGLSFTVPTIGVQVDQLPRAGYTVLVLGDDDRAFPLFHQGQGGATNFHTAVSWDFIPGIGAFSALDLPWIYEGGNDIEVIWPKAALDQNGRIHIVSQENPPEGTADRPQRIYYGWAEYNPSGFTMDICESQELIGWTNVIGCDVAASSASERVAIGWMEFMATGEDTNQYDNDVIVCISQDGSAWDWTDTINVTNFYPPEESLLPDTILANRDTLRAYADMCLLFDDADILHVFFTTRAYYSFEGTISVGNSFIWHWDEYHQVYSLVANGWFENGVHESGAWNVYVNRPSASIDPGTGDIYCMYQRYMNPIEYSQTLPYPYMVADTTDFSATDLPNGEIWVTKSTDGGFSWSQGFNITRTASPGAAAGDCMSEITPSMAPQITDDNLHIFYVLDRDAGAAWQPEGDWTMNDVIYHKISLEEIPSEPILDRYPMHYDSTGFPGEIWHTDPVNSSTPDNFALYPCYPNPFNPSTVIRFELRTASAVELTILDVTGREVAKIIDSVKSAGLHEVTFDGADLSSGIYLAVLRSGDFNDVQKMVLIK